MIETELTGGNEIRKLIREVGGIPTDLRKRLRPVMREAGGPVLADARRRADWSTRIPSAIRLNTSFTMRRAGLNLQVDRRRAPHARAYEGIRGNALFRHPVYGRDRWVGQKTRPFLERAVIARGLVVTAAVNRAVDQAARDAGFR